MTECSTITENDETFIRGTYNGIAIYVRENDGFVNVTKLCSDGGRDFRTFKRGDRYRSILEYYLKYEVSKDVQNCTPLYELKKSYNLMQGQYITPDLVHFVAEWISIEYSFKVKHLMDSINNKVHEELKKQELPDTELNAKPIFNEIAKSIVPDINFNNSSTWGYRDSPYELDQWEKDDLKRAINDYKEAKTKLDEAQNNLSSWGSFVNKYFSDLV